MSARLNMNPIRYQSWKGKTFNQVISFIQKNKGNKGQIHKREFFRAQPLKITRREVLVISNPDHIHNVRTSTSIDQFNIPGGNIVTQNERCSYGLEHTLDMTTEVNKHNTGVCTDKYICMEQNARRRVRSSGMVRKKYDEERNNVQKYFCDNKQYLNGRNKSFQQNFFFNLRQGEPSFLTDSAPKNNIYSSVGISDCKKVRITADGNNNFFSYIWINDSIGTYSADPTRRVPDVEYEVEYTSGLYDIESFYNRIKDVMEQNGHYLIHRITRTKVFLIKLIYNNYNDKIELQLLPYSKSIYPDELYAIPSLNNVLLWNPPGEPTVPCVRFITNEISRVTGFHAGYYPDISPWFSKAIKPTLDGIPFKRNNPLALLPQNQHYLFPMYKPVNYKPNNVNYAQQGAVSSSARVLRKKYDSITRNGATFIQPFGKEVSNAMAYGVSEHVYTEKDKVGFPIKTSPIFSKYWDVPFKKCVRKRNLLNG